jgi:uncharacterized membrane protein YfcA
VITSFSIADASLAQLALVCVAAFGAAIVGGLSGFGTGLILPVFVAPLVGVANVIPVMAVGMTLNNLSRVAAFRHDIAWPHMRRLLRLGLPLCIVGAYSYTLLSARWIGILLGAFLIASVPVRRVLARLEYRLAGKGETTAGAGFGFIDGAMTGTGAILISILMAAGVSGPALIATDAIVSAVMGAAKIVVFGGFAKLDLQLVLIGTLIGVCTAPGAFVARRLLDRIPARIHAGIMELVVLGGGVMFLWRALR